MFYCCTVLHKHSPHVTCSKNHFTTNHNQNCLVDICRNMKNVPNKQRHLAIEWYRKPINRTAYKVGSDLLRLSWLYKLDIDSAWHLPPITKKYVTSARSFGRLLRSHHVGMVKCHVSRYRQLQQEL